MQADPSEAVCPSRLSFGFVFDTGQRTTVNVLFLLLLLSAAATWDAVIPTVWADKQQQENV